jgi:hypothetical protein
MAQICSLGLERAITKVVANKPWLSYNRQENYIEVLPSPEGKIGEYNIASVTRGYAKSLNRSINKGREIGNMFYPTTIGYRHIVKIAPIREQLELLNAEDAQEIKELEKKILLKEATTMNLAEQERGGYDVEDRGEFYQMDNYTTEVSKASAQTVSLVKDFLNRIGVKVDILSNISVDGVSHNINGIASIMQKLVQVTEGKLDVALPEEAMHFAVEIIKEKDPKLYNKLLSEINGYQIYNRVVDEYGKLKAYQEANGKPNIKKLKDEAIAKVLAEVIIKRSEGINEKPENLAKVESWWQKIIEALKSIFSTSGFDQVAMNVLSGQFEGTIEDARSESTYFQVSADPQQKVIDALLNNPRATKLPDEKGYTFQEKMLTRVTDIVDRWYGERFKEKALTKSEYQQGVDDMKTEKGTAGHNDIRYMIEKHFLNSDRTFIREKEDRPDDSNYVSQLDPDTRKYYDKLKENMEERLASFGEGTKFFLEQTIFDGKSLVGTVDFLAITRQGRVSILDWKFSDIKVKDNKTDIAWYKREAWRLQMQYYKKILQDGYGIPSEAFDQTRMIPIKTTWSGGDAQKGIKPTFGGIEIGAVMPGLEERAYLLPLALETESTGNEKLDNLIEKLNKVYENIYKTKVTDSERAEKFEHLNNLFYAIRQLQMRKQARPLLEEAKTINAEVNRLIKEYKSSFEGRDLSEIDDQEKRDFASKIIEFEDALHVYKNLPSELSSIFSSNRDDASEQLWQEIRKTKEEADDLFLDLEKISKEFVADIIAKKENVFDYLAPERVIKGFAKMFQTTSTLQMKSTELLYKLANKAFAKASMDTVEQGKILMGLKDKYEIWAKSKGLSAKNQFDILKKKDKNELIDEFKVDYYTTLQKKIADKDFAWIKANIDLDGFKEAIKEEREKEIKRIEDRVRYKSAEENKRDIERELNEVYERYNTSASDSIGWLLYSVLKKHPNKTIWETDEWKELNKPENAPAKEFYDYIKSRNEAYNELGYINSFQSRTFLPFVRKTLMEKLVMGGDIKLGESLLRSITISEGDVGYGEIDPITKETIYSIPKYFTRDTGEEMSTDLFRNMTLLNDMAIRYKYLTDIEDQMRLVARVESKKEAIKTSYFGSTKYNKITGAIEKTSDNSSNTQLLSDMIEAIVYGHKYVESESFDQLLGSVAGLGKRVNKLLGVKLLPETFDDSQISMNKTITSLNNFFQLKTLGLNPISAFSNLMGGSFQSIINAGTYFTKGELFKNEMIMASKFMDQDAKKRLAFLEYFLPLTENYNNKIARELSVGVTQEGTQELLMSLMRESDQFIQSVNFFTYIDNTVVMDGKLVNARTYLRKSEKYEGIYSLSAEDRKKLEAEFDEDVKKLVEEKGVMKLATIDENNNLTIPGVDRKSDSVIELRRIVQSITKDALGNLSEDDVRRINLNIIGKSFMIFKGWIPRLVDVRFGNMKYNSATEAYEWGRTRMIMNVLSDNVLKSVGRLRNMLEANEKGVEYMREMFEEKKRKYKEETGKELRMTEQEFMDLVRKNIKDQAVDVVFYLTLTSMFWMLKALAPEGDDDDDIATKNKYKFMLRLVDKVKDEVAYFYNPLSLLDLTKSGIFPSIGLIHNFEKVFENFIAEMYYLGRGDEKAAQKNQVIKYALKGFPITYEFDIPILMFFPDLAKDLGMRAQSEARPKM